MSPDREDALWEAYRSTHYVVFGPEGELVLQVGAGSEALDRLLDDRGVRTWCFITAWNPASVRLDARANRARNAALKREIEAGGHEVLDGEGRGVAGDWPAEASLLVLGIERAPAIGLAQRFGQRAIVAGERGAAAELVDCGAVDAPER
jgi:hypothetical protein